MRKTLRSLLVAAAAILVPLQANAQAPAGNASLSVTTSTSRVALPTTTAQHPAVLIAPAAGSTQEVFYKLGGSTVVAAVTDFALPAGGICINAGPNTYVAAITASSTATVRITQLNVCPLFARGGSGGGGGAGTVTSVALSLPSIFTVSGSPVTVTGTLTGTLATQTANTVFAGPASGGAVAPTFRALVTADLPDVLVAGGPTGSATVAPVITWDAKGRLTVVTSATIAPPFSAITGSLACSQMPALTGDVTTSAGACATTLVTAQPGAHTWAAAQTFRAAVVVNLNATTAPTPITGTALQVVGADAVVGRVAVDSFGAIGAFTVRRANGTAAAPTALASNDQIGGFNFYGWYVTGGPAYGGPAGSLQGFATQAWTSTAFGTRIVIATTPNNSTTLTTALTVDQDQSVAMVGRATIATSLAIGGATIGSDAFAVTGTTTHVGNVTLSGTTLIFSGNISAAAWTTTGIRHRSIAATLTDTTSSGTVAAAYTNAFGGNTIAASSATVFTNYFTGYFNAATAGTNVTITNNWALGAASFKVDGNGALSAPAVNLVGTWITGGSATTTKPYVLIEPTGTTSTGWSTSGTGLGVNGPAAFGGDIAWFGVAGVVKANINSSGDVVAARFASAGSALILAAGVNGQFGAGGPLLINTAAVAWVNSANANSGTQDLFILRDAANILALRNGTTAQQFNLYKTFTDASNYERLAFGIGIGGASANVYSIVADHAGTGTLRAIEISSGIAADAGSASTINLGASGVMTFGTKAANWWQFSSTGHLIAFTDNTYDIGASGANRPRAIYAGTTVSVGTSSQLDTFGVRAGSGLDFYWASSTKIRSSTNGIITLFNAAENDFGRINFGGITSSFPAIGRSGTSLVIQLADATLQSFLTPVAAGTIQHGAADTDLSASIVAQTIRSQGALAGGTADQAGKNLTIDVSPGKGTGAGGSFIVRTAPAGASSTVQGTLTTALTISSAQAAVFAGALSNLGNANFGNSVLNVTSAGNGTVYLFSNTAFGWNGGDVSLFRGASDILRQARGTAAQKFEVYNTTDANFGTVTNYERGIFDWQGSANVLTIGTEAGGTGVARNMRFVIGGVLKADFGITTAATWTFATAAAASTTLLVGGNAWAITGGGNSVMFSGGLYGWASGVASAVSTPDAMFARAGAAAIQMGAVTGAGAAVAQTFTVQGSSGNSAAAALFTIAGSDQAGTTTTGGGIKIRGGNGTSAGGTVEIWTSATTTPAVAASFAADKSASFVATVRTGGYTVAGLPTAGTAGRRAYVTDQLTVCAATGAAITGGGAIVCPVFDNGVAWVGGWMTFFAGVGFRRRKAANDNGAEPARLAA